MLAVLTGSYSQKGRASPNKPQRRCCNKGAAAHALGLAHGSARLLGMLWRVRRARCGMLGGCGARGHGTQKLTRSANTFLIFGERIASRGIDGLGDRAGHGIPLHVMNGTAPNPGEGWASTGKVENRCVTVGAAEAAHAWLAPGGRRSQAIAIEGKNLCSVLTRYARGFHTSIAFPMAPKAMAQSVLMAASSEQGRNYKSEFADDWRPPRGDAALRWFTGAGSTNLYGFGSSVALDDHQEITATVCHSLYP